MDNKKFSRLIGISSSGNKIYTNSCVNPHITITGISGSGKTYLNYNIIIQDLMKGIPVVIIDVSDSYRSS